MSKFLCLGSRQAWVRVVVVIVVLGFASALVLRGLDAAGVAAVLTAVALAIDTAYRAISAASPTPRQP